jgi:hypothetical protein
MSGNGELRRYSLLPWDGKPRGQRQTNTDGIYIKLEKESDIELVKQEAHQWEKRTRLDLEFEVVNKIYQKDVNNYIIIDKDGKYKSKGSYVKKLSAIDYDLPIINEALVQYFVNNTPVEETILNCKDLIKFQKIVKVSRLYKYAKHGDKTIKERVLRVYASKEEDAHGLVKIKEVVDKDGNTNDRIEKIGNTPDKCFIYNDSVVGVSVDVVKDKLDLNYYVEVAKKRLDDFLSQRKEKKHKQENEIKFVNEDSKNFILSVYKEFKGDFIEFLDEVSKEPIVTMKHIKVMTILNNFKKFGKNLKLMKVIEIYEQLRNRKQINVNQIESLGVDLALLEKYSAKKTKILYKDIDILGLLSEMIGGIEDISMSIKEQVKNELEYLGYVNYTNPNASDNFYIVVEVVTYKDKTKPYLLLRKLNNGEELKTKIKDSNYFIENPVQLFDIVEVLEFKTQKKMKNVEGAWVKTDEDEYILSKYVVY